jgi:hypothetical protein
MRKVHKMDGTPIQSPDFDGSAANQPDDPEVVAFPPTVEHFLEALRAVVQDSLRSGNQKRLEAACDFVQLVRHSIHTVHRSRDCFQELEGWIASLQVDKPLVALLASLLFESHSSAGRRLDTFLDRWAKAGIVAEPIVEALQCFAWLLGETSLRALLSSRQQTVFALVAAGLNRPIDPRAKAPLSQPFEDISQLLTCVISRSQWEEIIHTIRFFQRDTTTGRYDGLIPPTTQRPYKFEPVYQNDLLPSFLCADKASRKGARALSNLTPLLKRSCCSKSTRRKIAQHILQLAEISATGHNDEIWSEARSLFHNHREELLSLVHDSPVDVQYASIVALFSADADWAACALFPLAWSRIINPCILFQAVVDLFEVIDLANKVYRPIALDVVRSALSVPEQFPAALRFLVFLTGASTECFFYLLEACDTETVLNAAQDKEIFKLVANALHYLLGKTPEKQQVAAIWQLCLSPDRRKIDLGIAVLERRMPGLSRILCGGFARGDEQIRWGGRVAISGDILGTQKLYLASIRSPVLQATDSAYLRCNVSAQLRHSTS